MESKLFKMLAFIFLTFTIIFGALFLSERNRRVKYEDYMKMVQERVNNSLIIQLDSQDFKKLGNLELSSGFVVNSVIIDTTGNNILINYK